MKKLAVVVLIAGILCSCDMFSPGFPFISFQYEGKEVAPGDTYDFGSVAVGSTKTMHFAVSNKGRGGLGLSCSIPPPFAADGFPEVIASGKAVNVDVRFSPLSAGSFSKQLTLYTNDPVYLSYLITFTGTGITP